MHTHTHSSKQLKRKYESVLYPFHA